MEKTLLDEFAMAALENSNWSEYSDFSATAKNIYKMAQAMMEERKKHVKEAEDGGWIDWSGGLMPVEANVEIMLRDGYIFKEWSLNLRWNHNGSENDIIKYRVLK